MSLPAPTLFSRLAGCCLATAAVAIGGAACSGTGGPSAVGTDARDAAARGAVVAVSPGAAAAERTHRPALPGAPGPACGLADFQVAALARINRLRATGADCRSRGRFAPAPPLAWNAALLQATVVRSRDMAAHNHFSHTGRNGSTMAGRIDAAGYTWGRVGENIATGQAKADAVIADWMSSDGQLRQPDERRFP